MILYQYNKYLNIYHEILSECLQAMSCDLEELYPYSLLEQQWKQYAKTALFTSPIIFSIPYLDKEDTPDVQNIKSTSDCLEQLIGAGS